MGEIAELKEARIQKVLRIKGFDFYSVCISDRVLKPGRKSKRLFLERLIAMVWIGVDEKNRFKNHLAITSAKIFSEQQKIMNIVKYH